MNFGKRILLIQIMAWNLLIAVALPSQEEVASLTLQKRLSDEGRANLASDVERFGDPVRGALSFFMPEMNCAKCHDVNASGRRLGPNLAERRNVTVEHLIQSVLNPSHEIKDGYETVLVQTADGLSITGVFVGETASELVVDQIEQPDKPLRISKDEIDQWRKVKKSSMPEQLVNQLSDRQQFLDLISYLVELSQYGPAREKELRPAESIFTLAPLPEYEASIDHRALIRAMDDDSFARGQETYRLRCESCHGTIEKEGTLPTSLRFASGSFKNGNEPEAMYRTLTHGFGMMNPQRWMVPKQKYDVIHYIREHFLKQENPNQYFTVTEPYLNSLPEGDTLGPDPVVNRPWRSMDYGPSLNNTIEVSDDGSNIAQKGIAIRLDRGPGGVESGRCWMLYDHDTMRVAGAWFGEFIDFNGIHFNGVHGRHPGISGQIVMANPVIPGWGRPSDQAFEDRRLLGRDGKRYGPLPDGWLRYRGLYRYGEKTVLKYSVGSTNVLESPGLSYIQKVPVFTRRLNIGPRDTDLVLQVLRTNKGLRFKSDDGRTLAFCESGAPAKLNKGELTQHFDFDGTRFAQIKTSQNFDMTESDFTIYAEINTEEDGTIFSQTHAGPRWVPNGKTFFVRDGRLHYDIGWVGVVDSGIKVDDGKWKAVALTWQSNSGRVEFFVDGKKDRAGTLKPQAGIQNAVQRLGLTNLDFPNPSIFKGAMRNVRFYSRRLKADELRNIATVDTDLVAHWNPINNLAEANAMDWVPVEETGAAATALRNLSVNTSLAAGSFKWISNDDGDLRLVIGAGNKPLDFTINVSATNADVDPAQWHQSLGSTRTNSIDLSRLTQGGPANWPQQLTTEVKTGQQKGAFQVDVLTRPVENPWHDRMRFTGLDFFANGRDAVVCCWDGSVYRVNGIDEDSAQQGADITWKRIAAGLFQPLGIRVVDGKIFVTCRDQLVCLHDLNGDGEIDWYQNFNSDHQVTEHFHEFAMGLQTDLDGNFYYAKSARHALPAVVPHHGTLLKVSNDGSSTEIVANGFRAANGVCLNPDGTFFVTDQEGHWNPKNRINWVQRGGFYGNMFGYHDVDDESDSAMEQPLCWITNAFDRSPAELLWVTSDRWKPLKGALLNFSYGQGKVFVVPHETVDGQMQGGMCSFPLSPFPTGIMRGRFGPRDGQLYCCGMFAWSGNQQQPGGLYRVRYTGQPVHLPIALKAKQSRLEILFSDRLDAESVSDRENYRITTWDLKRSANYGSDHYNEKQITVRNAQLQDDGRTVTLTIPELSPTWCMEIKYSMRTEQGQKLTGTIHNTIHRLAN